MYAYIFHQLPSDLRMEEKINLESIFFKTIAFIPVLRFLVARILIARGLVYGRVWKVDPKMPEQFRFKGWLIRNKSERADGTYLNNRGGFVFK